MPRCSVILGTLWLVLLAPCCCGAEVSFRNDVMAVLSRGGCNSGACHGNQNGKNGFKLSLRGEDPDFDWNSLTHDTQGRRVNRVDPRASLVLQKVVASVPHEGGQRFHIDSPEYAILRQWVEQGARRDPRGAAVLTGLRVTPESRILIEPQHGVQLKVEATFSDGTRRDVTRLSVYEPASDILRTAGDGSVTGERHGESSVMVRYLDRQATVRLAFVPARPRFVWKAPAENNYIDRLVFARLRELRMTPSAVCSDAEFLRRVYLDTIGLPPTPGEAKAFLTDKRSDRRDRLIDALLKRPEFNDFWALKWSDLLRNEEKALDAKGVQVFHQWIRQSLADRKPLNEFARELISGQGSTYSNPPANYYRALRDPEARAEATAQVFLGTRLQCAKCHNHPFDRWKQDDYHSLAAFFARVKYRVVENKRRDKLDKHEFVGDQIVWQDREGEVKHPRTGKVLPPRFLGEPGAVRDEDRLQALADWVARPDNPFFARAQANRVWYHLMGRGIVEPNDDFRASNPPANPALLDALAKDLADAKFDLRHLVRSVLRSRTYQLSARPNATNTEDEANASHALVRRLQAEQLLDALSQATGVPLDFAGQPAGTHAVQLPGTRTAQGRKAKLSEADRYLAQFGKPVRSLTCECERSEDSTLGQAFVMIGGKLLDDMLKNPDNRIGKLMSAGKKDGAIVAELFLASLARYPTPEEQSAAQSLVKKAKNRRQGFEDLLWGLVNTKEFILRR